MLNFVNPLLNKHFRSSVFFFFKSTKYEVEIPPFPSSMDSCQKSWVGKFFLEGDNFIDRRNPSLEACASIPKRKFNNSGQEDNYNNSDLMAVVIIQAGRAWQLRHLPPHRNTFRHTGALIGTLTSRK